MRTQTNPHKIGNKNEHHHNLITLETRKEHKQNHNQALKLKLRTKLDRGGQKEKNKTKGQELHERDLIQLPCGMSLAELQISISGVSSMPKTQQTRRELVQTIA